MIEQDTVKLLRECDAGTKMGISSIDEVINRVSSDAFRRILSESKKAHKELEGQIENQLERFKDDGKEPALIAKGMASAKTNFKLAVDDSDSTVADLMTDGCNMGIKSLNRYLNEYKAADERSKDIAKRLIALETKLCNDIRDYL